MRRLMPTFVIVKKQATITKISPFLYVSGLILLLLLSPCKVRNFIQAELDLPQTEVSNKSQTTLSQASCESFETSTTEHSSTQSSIQLLDVHRVVTAQVNVALVTEKQGADLTPASSPRSPDTPYYILYQNLLLYS